MATIAAPPPADSEDEQAASPTLTQLALPPGYVPGKYASFDMSPEPIFGPDELGEYKSAVDDLSETVTRADSSARIWEVLQGWELRLFVRNYQFLSSGRKGWGMAGAINGTNASGQEIMQSQQAGKLFSCNVLGARETKIVAALAREVPGLTFVPKRDADSMDQTAADEAKKYLKVWLNDAGIKEVVGQIASLFYTDDRVVLYTRSVADEQRWGTETPEEQQETFDAPTPQGVTPETENQPDAGDSEVPAVREITTAYGKLECKVPIAADSMHEMPWIRIATEQNVNTLKERYLWIEDKINAGSSVGGGDQLDRQARINVRLAVQSSSSSGESWQQDATETITWFRPSQYRAIKNKDLRALFYENFPDGLRVVHAGSELAYIRNESLNKHLTVLHPVHGPGQNRRAIGTNYLPLQKVLNANFSLIDRYFRSGIARRFALEGPLDVQAMNGQINDPAKTTAVSLSGLPAGTKIGDITGVENVPQPNTAIFEFVQWLIEGAPEVMDGAAPAMFGAEDADTFGATKLNRDQALQVFSLPWSQICTGLAKAAEQAVQCAGKNRVANMQSNIPGQGKLQVEISKLQGNALCYPESMEIPQTIAEQEAQMAELLENSQNVALYQAIANDPRNLTVFKNFPSLAPLNLPGVNAVEQQDGEMELLLQSGPLDNPQLAQITLQVQQMQQAIQQGATDLEAQTPQGQQMMQQLQQQMAQLQQQAQQIPTKVSSVPVAQNGTENHAIHAAITFGFMEGSEGRKLKNGSPQQQAVYQNILLHWNEHEEMKQKLTPVKPLDVKASATVAIDKLPPNVQAQALQAMGVQAQPSDFEDANELVPHETVIEKEGVDANGVPVKQKISMTNPGGKLS